ncbi:hypothetical protein KBI52_22180 [Microvirga sp. HBU67558]|uniref:hypothetical protein n=1 Tax=Microvirga TaxID=186650 RepID=UPI001B38DBC6|nr:MULTISPECIES: hypothetical protein [unclassified Microvirga]MBQ0822900.1 hypothetical protein [Microvirga sp. HBU67558]
MKTLTVLASAALITVGGIGLTVAQPNPVRGTPGSPFPYAAAHEIQTINGVPCRTMYDKQLGTRVPIACAGGDVPVARVDVATTGSTRAAVASGVPIAGTPNSLFPYATPNEIRTFNGVPCRTMYDRQLQARIPIACAGEVMVRRVQ